MLWVNSLHYIYISLGTTHHFPDEEQHSNSPGKKPQIKRYERADFLAKRSDHDYRPSKIHMTVIYTKLL
ncbi:hypothetical protein SK128_024038 [Halocaridina rubra]|uniref:Uncharacterized protein n=1 Tax=Halocaridina rubra TaxID=373956 RepID=A0AAN9AH16_HALRR